MVHASCTLMLLLLLRFLSFPSLPFHLWCYS
jgi:hypothetical protein